MRAGLCVLVAAFTLAACAPADGPTVGGVKRNARAQDIPIVALSPEVIAAIGTQPRPAGLSRLGHRRFRADVINPGDAIEVAILDSGEEGMLTAGSIDRADLGTFVVSPSGTISLPFIGGLNVAGQTTAFVQSLIAARLRERSLDPQAAVTVVREPTDVVTVQGTVVAAGALPLTARGERVLDAVAQAGGAEGDPAVTTVTVLRGSGSATGLLADIRRDPSQNVPLQPGDTVVVGGGESSILADGAVNGPGAISFVPGGLSLQDAVAQAGGLSASRAQARSVFVFRRQAAGESFLLQQRDGAVRPVFGDVIVRADFNDPKDQLEAGEFQMRDGDVLYVGERPLARFGRILALTRGAASVPGE